MGQETFFNVCCVFIWYQDFSSFADNRVELSKNGLACFKKLLFKTLTFDFIGFGHKSYPDFWETGPIWFNIAF